jgi:AcrR family transcriptional regulator
MANIASEEKIARRKAEILIAAIDVFSSQGFHKAGIADIAKKLNIGHGTVYRYFKNKRDIFNAILAELLGQMAEIVMQEPPNTDSLEQYSAQLQRIADGLLAIFHRDPRLAKIAFYESMGVDPEATESVEHLLSVFAQFTEQYMKNGIAKSFLRPTMNTRIAANLVTAMLVETIKQVAADGVHDEDEIDAWRQEIIQFMVGGLGKR